MTTEMVCSPYGGAAVTPLTLDHPNTRRPVKVVADDPHLTRSMREVRHS